MTDKKGVYERLEAKMLKYKDLSKVAVRECGEDLVSLQHKINLQTRQIDPRMSVYGKQIYVRQTVSNMLSQVSKLLARVNPEYTLEIVYGYRSLNIQQILYKEAKQKFQRRYSGSTLTEATHRYIAVPSVAGHPTGGAVDVQIIAKTEPLNYGTKIWQFSPNSYTYSPFVSKEGQSNRLLLRGIMLSTGFAPFDGEWWHFSYGDKEWAKYYNKPYAIYKQIEFRNEV